jgi:glycosyltransferase involved in cell wall biosynthesis
MKICLIGPTYPFRGGISHYTTLLYRHLKKRHEVRFFAFKRQYPEWLFPGATDKDSSSNPIREDGAENILDSLNPITWMKVFLRIKRVNPELVILPWWVSFWTPQFWTIATFVKIFTKTNILFICHNVVEHESKRIDKLCTKFVLRKGDYFLVHSGEDFENLKKFLPDAYVKQNAMPIFEVFHSDFITKADARKQLNIEGNIILFFGFVRPYKGLKYLLKAMPIITRQIDVHLFIVGEFWKGEEEYRKQIEDLGVGENITIINKYVPNEEVGMYFAASDLAVLPYTSATGSAIVQTAFSCNKPVISTNVGCLPEIIDHERTGYVVPARDSQAIAKAVIAFYKEGREDGFVKNIIQEKEKFSWDKMVETIESFIMKSGTTV